MDCRMYYHCLCTVHQGCQYYYHHRCHSTGCDDSSCCVGGVGMHVGHCSSGKKLMDVGIVVGDVDVLVRS